MWGPGQVPILPYTTIEAPLTSLTPRPGYPPQPGQNDPPQGESGFVDESERLFSMYLQRAQSEDEYLPRGSLPQGSVDGSGPLFSMYLQLAGERDKKMTEDWKGDADGILVFVSHYSTCRASSDVHPEVEDRFILCRRRSISRCVCAGP